LKRIDCQYPQGSISSKIQDILQKWWMYIKISFSIFEYI
jgi:hypothetical protein